MKKLFLLFLLFLLISQANAQDYHKIDSLKEVLNNMPPIDGTDADTSRMKVCIEIGDLYKNYQIKSAIKWYSEVSDTSINNEKLAKYPARSKLNINALINIGLVFSANGNYYIAVNYVNYALKIAEVIDDKKLSAKCYVILGTEYSNLQEFVPAKTSFSRAIEISKDNAYDKTLMSSYMGMGNVFLWEAKYSDAIEYYKLSVELAEKSDNKNHEIMCLINMGYAYNMNSNFSESYSVYLKALSISQDLNDENYIYNCYFGMGDANVSLGNKSDAIENFQAALGFAQVLSNKNYLISANFNIGLCYYDIYNYKEALNYFEQALKFAIEINDRNSMILCYQNIGNINVELAEYKSALKSYESSQIYARDINDIESIVSNLHSIGRIYYLSGDYKSAAANYEKAFQIACKSENVIVKLDCLNSMGILNKSQGNFPEAIECYENSLKIAEQLNDAKGISQAIINLGNVYAELANYDKAAEYYNQGLVINQKSGNKSNISACLNNLGSIYFLKDDYENALNYYEQSLKLRREANDKNGICECLANLGAICLNSGMYTKAKQYIEEALSISQETGNKGIMSDCLMSMGNIMDRQKLYKEAIEYYLQSLKIKSELGANADLALYYQQLARVYYKSGNSNDAVAYMLKARELTIELLSSNFAILSEKEKEIYLNNTIAVFNSVNEIAMLCNTDSLKGICFNNELILKGLLLSSSTAVINAVYNSNDAVLIESFVQYRLVREQISALQSAGDTETIGKIASLETKADDLERLLVKGSSGYANIKGMFQYQWQDVQKSLKPSEAAIEFVLVRNNLVDPGKKGKDFYAALILKPGASYPEMIYLCSQDSLTKLLENKEASSRAYVSNIYRGVIIGNNNSVPIDLYPLIWKPLNQYLNDVKTVYLSPCGLLHQVAFAALPTPDKKLLSDKYNIYTVSGTRVLTEQSDSLKLTSVALFGGIVYDQDSAFAEALSEWHHVHAKDIYNEIQRAGNNNFSVWKYLPGTLEETENLYNLMQENAISVSFFNRSKATEERFKSFSQVNSPTAIHIATHGFSIPENDKYNAYKIFENSFVLNSNPLFRTGLLFAGASRVWNREKPLSGMEDGILTAYEVSNMNLQNTKLVVLSACETGLGEVKGSEGVYGLQRAFKMAGVKYVIVSLWQVPDKETGEFMENFYSNLLESNNIRVAFSETQKYMRKKYDPYYWAAFVLVE